MKINNYSLNELRKYYAKSEKFIIRIREQSKEKSKKDCKDIVYCEGIKAFYVENKECLDNTVTITIPENIYKINQTNLYKIINSVKEDKFTKELDTYFNYLKKNSIEYNDNLREELYLYLCDIENRINNFVSEKAELKQNLKSYFEINIKGGQFKFGKVFLEDTEKTKSKEIQEQVKIRLRLLNERLKEIGTGFDVENIIEKFKNIKNYKNDKIIFKLQNTEKLSLVDLTKIEALMILYTTFTLKIEKLEGKLKEDNYSGLAEPEFNYDSNFNSNYNKDSKNLDILDKFNKDIENAILEYEISTKVELEKKYQHSFMIKNKLSYYPNLSSVIPFEEEYYTTRKEDDSKDDDTSDKRGRIDCIFVDTKENKNDIYLIELKVNEGVIGKKDDLDEHGINTHLVDINNLLNNENNLSLNTFLENIKNRYNYRNEILDDPSRISDIKNCNLHYWIICAIKGDNYEEEKDHAKKVWEKINALKDDKYIKAIFSVKLLETGEECLKSKDGNNQCDLKLLFNIWKDDKNNKETKFLTIEEFKNYYNI